MTDLEITKLCAEAMEIDKDVALGATITSKDGLHWVGGYNPLNDDAQAMALVNKFSLTCEPRMYGTQRIDWMCREPGDNKFNHLGNTINRAICECVAKVQKAKCQGS